MLSRQRFPRRTFLRGVGAAVAFQAFGQTQSEPNTQPNPKEEAAALVGYRTKNGDFHEWGDMLVIYGVDGHKIKAVKDGGTFRRADRTIYMDGRPHPSEYAPHTWAGFTTGKWVGNTLVTTTTHIKWAWIRRNGVPSSDEATVTTFYTRNDNYLTITWMVHHPLYLTETYTKSTDFVPTPQIATAQFDVEPAGVQRSLFQMLFERRGDSRRSVFRAELPSLG